MNKKKRLIRLICLAVIVISVVSLATEISKHLISYNSPEEAYIDIQGGDIYAIVEGEKTVKVVGEKEGLFLIKTNKGYKYPFQESSVLRAFKHIDDYVITVYEYNGMQEYYITISAYEDIYPTIEDNRNTTFYRVVELDEWGSGICGYFGYIDGFDKDYEVTIDGKTKKLLD